MKDLEILMKKYSSYMEPGAAVGQFSKIPAAGCRTQKFGYKETHFLQNQTLWHKINSSHFHLVRKP